MTCMLQATIDIALFEKISIPLLWMAFSGLTPPTPVGSIISYDRGALYLIGGIMSCRWGRGEGVIFEGVMASSQLHT